MAGFRKLLVLSMKAGAFFSKAFAVITFGTLLLSLVGCVHKPENKEAPDRKISLFAPARKTKSSSDSVIDPNKFSNELKRPVTLMSGLIKWSKSSIEGEIAAPPVVARDVFFILGKDCLIKAYKIKGCQLVWSASIGSISNASMLVRGDRLYVASGDCITAFSTSEGKQLFYSKLQAPISSGLCFYNEMCYVQTALGLHAINTENGAVTTEPLNCGTNPLSQFSPAVYKNKIVFTSCVGHVAILDAGVDKSFPRLIRFASGANPPSSVSKLVSQPILDKKYCYFATSHGALQKCDLEKETVVWSLEVPVIQSISLLGNIIVATTEAGQVMAIKARTGRVVWTSNLKVNGSDDFLPPLVPRMVLLLTLSTYSVIHSTTALLGGGTTQFSDPAAVNPIIVISRSGSVFTLHPTNGGILRTIKLPCEDKIISAAMSGSRLMLFGERGSVLKSR